MSCLYQSVTVMLDDGTLDIRPAAFATTPLINSAPVVRAITRLMGCILQFVVDTTHNAPTRASLHPRRRFFSFYMRLTSTAGFDSWFLAFARFAAPIGATA